MTLSLVARSGDARLFGMVIASSSPAVAARCAHARAGVGVVATQNITDPALGPRLLDALQRGDPARTALAAVLAATPQAAYRQLIVLGAGGPPAVHSGAHALGTVGVALAGDCAAAGNLLAHEGVPATMVQAFAAVAGEFAPRLLAALRAGAAGGGEAGPLRSAGLLVVRDLSWPLVDLRVDWDETDPIAALGRLWEVYAPQVEDYVRRALEPGAAPSYGVPGDP